MHRKLIPALLFSFFALVSGGQSARAMEVIRSYHADIDVAKSGALTVTETITVEAENEQIRHGIYRDFPLTFTGDDGQMHRVDFDLVSIKRDGQPEDFKSEGLDGRGTRILIGKADVIVPTGEHTYEIAYRTGRQIRYFPNHDELFWNVTGNGWQFPIEEATATVILPPDVKPEATVFYTGKLGATEKNARATEADGRVFFATTRPLGVHEGLTIGVKFAKGAILAPGADQLFWWSVHDRMNAITAGICLLVVLLYFAIQWFRVGRDPSKGIVVPRWEPPSDLSPALVNYVWFRGFNNNGWTAFSSAAIDLAVKGLITLEDLKKSVTFKATGKAADDKLPREEEKIYSTVKGAGASFAINKDNGPRIESLGSSFRDAIEKVHSGKYYRHNLGTIAWGILLTILAYVVILMVGDFTEDMLGLLVVPAFIFVFVAIFSAVLAATMLSSQILVMRIIGGICIFAFWLAFALIIAVSIWGAIDASRSPDDIIAYIATCAMIVIAAFFTTVMGAATPLGRQLRDGIEGLRLYLTVAEKQRMNMAGAPEMSPQHYEKLLPYAVALGVERPWSEHFQAWLATAAGAAAATYQPYWYNGSDYNYSQFGDRMSSFSSSLASTITSSLPPPSSSSSGFSSSGGFSGGGSSGGGGGGGGGGGW
jgi:uncharacterized membrane protein YgcG